MFDAGLEYTDAHHVFFFNCFHHEARPSTSLWNYERQMRQTVKKIKRVIGNRGLGLVMHGAQNQ